MFFTKSNPEPSDISLLAQGMQQIQRDTDITPQNPVLKNGKLYNRETQQVEIMAAYTEDRDIVESVKVADAVYEDMPVYETQTETIPAVMGEEPVFETQTVTIDEVTDADGNVIIPARTEEQQVQVGTREVIMIPEQTIETQVQTGTEKVLVIPEQFEDQVTGTETIEIPAIYEDEITDTPVEVDGELVVIDGKYYARKVVTETINPFADGQTWTDGTNTISSQQDAIDLQLSIEKANVKAAIKQYATNLRSMLADECDQYQVTGWENAAQRSVRIDTSTDIEDFEINKIPFKGDKSIVDVELKYRNKDIAEDDPEFESQKQLTDLHRAMNSVYNECAKAIEGIEKWAKRKVDNAESMAELQTLIPEFKTFAQGEFAGLLGKFALLEGIRVKAQ